MCLPPHDIPVILHASSLRKMHNKRFSTHDVQQPPIKDTKCGQVSPAQRQLPRLAVCLTLQLRYAHILTSKNQRASTVIGKNLCGTLQLDPEVAKPKNNKLVKKWKLDKYGKCVKRMWKTMKINENHQQIYDWPYLHLSLPTFLLSPKPLRQFYATVDIQVHRRRWRLAALLCTDTLQSESVAYLLVIDVHRYIFSTYKKPLIKICAALGNGFVPLAMNSP